MMKLISVALLFVCATANAGHFAEVVAGDTSVVLPAVCLPALDDTPAGGTYQTDILNSTAGLEIKYRVDTTNGWIAQYSQAGGTINDITADIGTFETPEAAHAHWEEIAAGAGCYQLILPDIAWDVAGARYVDVLIRDVSTPTFADTMIRITQNVADENTFTTWLTETFTTYGIPTITQMTAEFLEVDETFAIFVGSDGVTLATDQPNWTPGGGGGGADLSEEIDEGVTAACALALQTATLVGEFTQTGSAVEIRDVTGQHIRVTATITANGRTDVVINCPE